jgi:hypothetical protein
MSDDFAFTPPPFKPADALAGLKRQLRELKLVERAGAFELQGSSVVQLQAGDSTIDARLAKRPARSPEWTRHTLRSGADVRRFVDTVKQQLARWSAADE